MFTVKHARTGAASLAALTALAFGGSAIANAAQSSPSSPPAAVTSTVDTPTPGDTADNNATDVATPGDKADNASGPDTDNVQSGDQSTAGDKADSADVAEAGDKADSATESGSEVSGADGPGGHADEPGAQVNAG